MIVETGDFVALSGIYRLIGVLGDMAMPCPCIAVNAVASSSCGRRGIRGETELLEIGGKDGDVSEVQGGNGVWFVFGAGAMAGGASPSQFARASAEAA